MVLKDRQGRQISKCSTGGQQVTEKQITPEMAAKDRTGTLSFSCRNTRNYVVDTVLLEGASTFFNEYPLRAARSSKIISLIILYISILSFLCSETELLKQRSPEPCKIRQRKHDLRPMFQSLFSPAFFNQFGLWWLRRDG